MMTDPTDIEAEVSWTARINEMAQAFLQRWLETDEDSTRETILADCMTDARMTADVALRIASLTSAEPAMLFLGELSRERRAALGLPEAA